MYECLDHLIITGDPHAWHGKALGASQLQLVSVKGMNTPSVVTLIVKHLGSNQYLKWLHILTRISIWNGKRKVTPSDARTKGSARGSGFTTPCHFVPPPPSPSPPTVPSPYLEADLNSVCVVTPREHSLAGRPNEEPPHQLSYCLLVCWHHKYFETAHIIGLIPEHLANSQKKS